MQTQTHERKGQVQSEGFDAASNAKDRWPPPKEASKQLSLEPSERAWPRGHLNGGLLASRAVRASGFISSQLMILCYSSHRK